MRGRCLQGARGWGSADQVSSTIGDYRDSFSAPADRLIRSPDRTSITLRCSGSWLAPPGVSNGSGPPVGPSTAAGDGFDLVPERAGEVGRRSLPARPFPLLADTRPPASTNAAVRSQWSRADDQFQTLLQAIHLGWCLMGTPQHPWKRDTIEAARRALKERLGAEVSDSMALKLIEDALAPMARIMIQAAKGERRSTDSLDEEGTS